MDTRRTQLLSSIVLTLVCYSGMETLGLIAVGCFIGIADGFVLFFIIIQAVFHGLLYAFLYLCRNLFYIENNGTPLEKVNIANKITLLRISMLPSILFLILSAKEQRIAPILMVALAVAFVTDLIDGRISRALNEVTRIGRILDSVSDYSLLIVIAAAYGAYQLLPLWLFLIIFFRLLFQAFGMLALLLIKKRVEPQPTVFGKIAIATTMSLFALEALKLVAPEERLNLFAYIEGLAGIVVTLSVFEKGCFFFRQSR